MTPEPYTQDDYDCGRPPPGWKCTRKAGHEGPCAAVEYHVMTSDKPWIGVDLDATLAHYDEWRGIDHIGPPIEPMRQRVLQWLAEGKEVRILTARVGPQRAAITHTIKDITHHIEQWCLQHLGQVLPVTCQKDYNMTEFYDDRCIQVIPNTGRTLEEDIQSTQFWRGRQHLHCGHLSQYLYKQGDDIHCSLCAIAELNQRLIDRTTGFMQTLGQQALEIADLKRERDDARKEAKTNAVLAVYEHGHITENQARQLTKCGDLVFFRILREQAFKEMCSLLELPDTPTPPPQP